MVVIDICTTSNAFLLYLCSVQQIFASSHILTFDTSIDIFSSLILLIGHAGQTIGGVVVGVVVIIAVVTAVIVVAVIVIHMLRQKSVLGTSSYYFSVIKVLYN